MNTYNTESSFKSRRALLNLFVFTGIGIVPFNEILPANAQKPPPRPKVTSIPQECLQAGGCGMVGMDENLPKFKAADQAPEVLDPKTGLYSSGLKIQEIAVGDEKGLAVADGRTVSLQVSACSHLLDNSDRGYYCCSMCYGDQMDTSWTPAMASIDSVS